MIQIQRVKEDLVHFTSTGLRIQQNRDIHKKESAIKRDRASDLMLQNNYVIRFSFKFQEHLGYSTEFEMATSNDLEWIGNQEAPATIEEFNVGRKTRTPFYYNQLQSAATNQAYYPIRQTCMDSKQAAKKYGGVMIVEYRAKKTTNPTTRNPL